MKKWQKISLISLGFILVFVIGLYLGIVGNKGESGYDVETIAIVNLDEGVMYRDEQRYFSNELLKDLDYNYIFTGLSDARNGVNSGKYGAYIVIPANFSLKVISINNTPEIIQYSYEISGDLTKKSQERLISSVYNFDQLLNMNIGKLYLSSILTEFHTAQDGGSIIIANDSKELELILAIQSSDLTQMIQLREFKPVENNIEELDLSLQQTIGDQLISDLDSSYRNYMQLSAEQLDNIKTDFGNMSTSVIGVRTEVDSLVPIINEDGTTNFTFYNTDNYLNDFNANSNLIVVKDSLKSVYQPTNIDYYEASKAESNIQNQIFTYLQANPTSTYDEAITYFRGTGELDNEIQTFFESLEIPTTYTIDTYNAYYTTDQSNRYTQYSNVIAEIDNASNTIIGLVGTVDINDLHDEIVKDLVSLNNSQTIAIENIKGFSDDLSSSYSSLTPALTNYDPIANINDEEIAGLKNGLDDNFSDIMSEVVEKNDEYSTYASDVTKNSNEHISDIQKDVYDANEAASRLIEKGLEEVKNVKKANSSENQEFLNQFIRSLDYTRRDSLTNQEAVDFIIKPVNMTGLVVDSNGAMVNNNLERGLIYIIIALVVLIAGVLSSILINKKEKV